MLKLMLGLHQFRQRAFSALEALFEKLSQGQCPEIFFITCSDSRLDPHLFTQAPPGEMFSLRNVGNIIPPYTADISNEAGAAIEYAISILNVKHIILCGHSDCGAMKGLTMPNLKTPKLAEWLALASSVPERLKKKQQDLDASSMAKENILLQIEHLKTYPLIAAKIAAHELSISGWFYQISNSTVFVYQEGQAEFIPLEETLKLPIEDRRDHVVKQVAIEYLSPLIYPKTAVGFQATTQLFSKLHADLLPIWSHLRPSVSERLWANIGPVFRDHSDQDFQEWVESGAYLKLDLQPFKKQLQESAGCHQWYSQLIRKTWFMNPLPSQARIDAIAQPKANKPF